MHTIYAVFGGRDELLRAVFERHSPLLDIEDFIDGEHTDLTATVRRPYGVIAENLSREPRIGPALLAEALARPHSPAVQNLVGRNVPRVLSSLVARLAGQIAAGRIRELPLPLLLQQLVRRSRYTCSPAQPSPQWTG